MSLLAQQNEELEERYGGLIVKFLADVRIGKLEGPENLALATVTLFEQIINESKNATAFELTMCIRWAGGQLSRALPREPVLANTARRLLRAIRTEQRQLSDRNGEGATAGSAEGDSLQRLVRGATARRGTLPAAAAALREPLREHIAELRLELEGSSSGIAALAPQHIHADECILTRGASPGAEAFLRAARARRYRLLVAEGAPGGVRESHAMAARLAAAGVPVTVVSDAAVYALMSRVNKVVLSAEEVVSGGAARAAAGARAVTAAAKMCSVPVVMLAPLYKLSPQHCSEHTARAPLASPAHAMPYEYLSDGPCPLAPQLDYIPPDHVTLYITNLGGSSPSYIYRLLSELYDPCDTDI